MTNEVASPHVSVSLGNIKIPYAESYYLQFTMAVSVLTLRYLFMCVYFRQGLSMQPELLVCGVVGGSEILTSAC